MSPVRNKKRKISRFRNLIKNDLLRPKCTRQIVFLPHFRQKGKNSGRYERSSRYPPAPFQQQTAPSLRQGALRPASLETRSTTTIAAIGEASPTSPNFLKFGIVPVECTGRGPKQPEGARKPAWSLPERANAGRCSWAMSALAWWPQSSVPAKTPHVLSAHQQEPLKARAIKIKGRRENFYD